MKRAYLLIIILGLFIIPSHDLSSEAKGLEPAIKCRQCHRDIYEQWKSSRHAGAFSEPIFRRIYNRILKKSPEDAATCIYCHSPLAVSPTNIMEEGLTPEEGVTCDFCHTVKELRVNDQFPNYVNTPGTKRGPYDNRKSTYHDTEFSPLLLDARFCSGCHEFTNRKGIKILSTYSEWEKSFYRGEGVHCQYCHLPQLFKDEQYQPGSGKTTEFPDHTMKGGHYPEQLKDAVKMSGSLKTSGRNVTVALVLFNDKSGHKLPTGIPTHRIVVAASVFTDSGKKVGEEEIFIERVLGDDKGNPLTSPVDIFLNAEKVLKDNRLGPKEKRSVNFDFPVTQDYRDLSATVSLFYELPSLDRSLKNVRINFSNLSIPLSKGQFPFQPVIILLLLITAALVTYDIIIRKRMDKE